LPLPWAFALGFGLILLLWAFRHGKLLEEKRMAKEGLTESLHRDL
jgi:hypothetical protein